MTNKELARSVSNMLYGMYSSDGRLLTHSGGILQVWGTYRDYLRRVARRKKNPYKCVKGHNGCALVEGGPCSIDVTVHLAKHDEGLTEKEMNGDLASDQMRLIAKLFRAYYKSTGMPKQIQDAVELLGYVTEDVEELERQMRLIAN